MDDKKPQTTIPFFAREANAAMNVRSSIRAGLAENNQKREELRKNG